MERIICLISFANTSNSFSYPVGPTHTMNLYVRKSILLNYFSAALVPTRKIKKQAIKTIFKNKTGLIVTFHDPLCGVATQNAQWNGKVCKQRTISQKQWGKMSAKMPMQNIRSA